MLEALKEVSSLSALAKQYDLAPTQISGWKRQFLEGAEDIFASTKGGKTEEERERDKLLRTIGARKVELDFLKKVLK